MKQPSPHERRIQERFDMALPAKIIWPPESMENDLILQTSNVSAGGAFFETAQPILTGTKVLIKMSLPPIKIGDNGFQSGQIDVSGQVLRAGSQGMAVFFYDNFIISSRNMGFN